MHTFAVDDVTPAALPLPPARFDPATVLGAPVLATSPALTDVVGVPDLEPWSGVHGLAQTVHLAFSQHRPLSLSPDAIWLTIAQGFALHVRANHAALRERFVRHAGQQTISIAADQVDWPSVAEGFATALAEPLGPGLVRALTDRFSTTTATAHTAHVVTLMDAFSRYFDFELRCICGLPRVTLEGTVADWKAVAARFDVLAEYDLGAWHAQLAPVLAKLVETAEGKPDPEFWRSIYKPVESYGGEVATGWLVRLYPYLSDDGVLTPNPMTPAEAPGRKGLRGLFGQGKVNPWLHVGLAPRRFPKGLHAVPIRLVDGPSQRLVELCAGFFGTTQDAAGTLSAQIGWAVREAPLAALWDALARRHAMEPPVPIWLASSGVPALLQEFHSRFGAGRCFGGELVLTPQDRASEVPLETESRNVTVVYRFALRLGQLRDGGVLLLVRSGHGQDAKEQILLAQGPIENRPHPIVADSLLELYQRLASGASFPPWEVKGEWVPDRNVT